mmetsp:Transcript_20677/g.63240  ORF Transcript_20677/g.63240 Transcript_20677/m.63240 type:complete len:211 (+) Transcript_20677:1410-2042(+)|eukprot:scaffold171852_cov27-Tisochrysis_lutea.AAC.3
MRLVVAAGARAARSAARLPHRTPGGRQRSFQGTNRRASRACPPSNLMTRSGPQCTCGPPTACTRHFRRYSMGRLCSACSSAACSRTRRRRGTELMVGQTACKPTARPDNTKRRWSRHHGWCNQRRPSQCLPRCRLLRTRIAPTLQAWAQVSRVSSQHPQRYRTAYCFRTAPARARSTRARHCPARPHIRLFQWVCLPRPHPPRKHTPQLR